MFKNYNVKQKKVMADFCFLIDITASSEIWTLDNFMELIEQCMCEYMNKVQSYKELRIALVTYWDYDPACANNQTVSRIGFDFQYKWPDKTDVLEECKRDPHFYYGGDQPEAFLAGLKATINLSWKSPKRFLFVLTDAPGHGQNSLEIMKKCNIYDNFPDGDPTGLTIESVSKMLDNEVHLSKLVCFDTKEDGRNNQKLLISYIEKFKTTPSNFTTEFYNLSTVSKLELLSIMSLKMSICSLKYLSGLSIDIEKQWTTIYNFNTIPRELLEYLYYIRSDMAYKPQMYKKINFQGKTHTICIGKKRLVF